MRLVLDTNVVVAALRSNNGASRLWLESVVAGNNTMLLSVALIMEYEDVLTRPEMRAATGLDPAEIGQILDQLCAVAEPVVLHYRTRPLLVDPGDEMVIETAMIGRADLLLTFNLRDFAGADRVGVMVAQPGPAWQRLKENSL